jgi:hypothetical protein
MSYGCRLVGKLRTTREDAKRNEEEIGNVLVFSPEAKDEGRFQIKLDEDGCGSSVVRPPDRDDAPVPDRGW